MTPTTTQSPAPEARFEHVSEVDVSIIVVTYGTDRIIVDTLTSIGAAAGALSIEVIVVDNPHPEIGDRTATDLSLFTSGVRVVRPEINLGFGGGCEMGALHARGRFLAFVNPDVVVPAGWLEPLVDLLGDPTVAIAAPVLANPDGSIQEAGQRLGRNGQTSPIRSVPPEHADRPFPVDYASAACWVMSADVHEALGGFDPQYHPAYFEDVDVALRARSAGLRSMVHPGIRVAHVGGGGTPGVAEPASRQRDLLLETWPEIRWRATSA